MGQRIGKATFDARAKPFVNLPSESIQALWQEFNLCADGWGVGPIFFNQLCRAISTSMGIDPDEKANSDLFCALDTDKNDLVDGLEVVSTLGMLSGMTRDEKVEFMFACYDVGGRASLSMNELFLLLKSTSTGLCKLSGVEPPDSARLESIASLVFMHNKSGMEGGLSLSTLSDYFDTNPVACSWLDFYDDCDGQENNAGVHEGHEASSRLEVAVPDIYDEKTFFATRSKAQEDANIGAEEKKAATTVRGAWVEVAQELVPPPPPPEEAEDAPENPDAEDESSPAAEGTGEPVAPPPPPPAPPAPDAQLSLEWVYGYSAAPCRASVCYTASDAVSGGGAGIVYPAGKVAVVLSHPLDEEGLAVAGDRVQSFMQEHTDEITALAVSPCGNWVSTGETGAHPKILVWNVVTKQVRAVVIGFHRVGITAMTWSPSGALLASVGGEEFHSLQIVEVSTARPIFRARTGISRPLSMAWTGDGNCLVTCGQTHENSPPLVFWVKEASTNSFTKKRGIAGIGKLAPSSDVQLVVCASLSGGKANAVGTTPPSMISGTIGGGLCLWKGRNCCKAIADAHDGAVEVLSVANTRGGMIASGGRDAKVKLWSEIDLSPVATLDIMTTPSVAGIRQVRSVCLSSDCTRVLVGTLGSDIFELAAVEKPKDAEGDEDAEEDQAIAEEGEGEEAVERMKPSGIGRVLNRGQPLVCGHCTGQTEGARNELRGVDVSPQGDQFVTVGDDGTVRVWSNTDKKIIRTLNMGSPALCVAYSPDSSLIAVGLSGGGLSVLKPSEEDVTTLLVEKVIDAFQENGASATCVRFSPNGLMLVGGSGNGGIKAWGTAEREWKTAGSNDKAVSGAVTGMDFTTEGNFIMANSIGMNMVIINADTCKKASPKEMKALRGEGEGEEPATWATSTCTMANGKQAAWATMLPSSADVSSSSDHNASTANSADDDILTGSDLIKEAESAVLLASDSLGRLGLLRYPAQLPDVPVEPVTTTEGAPPASAVQDSAGPPPASVENGKTPAAVLARAVEEAVPRVSIMKAHAGKVAAARQIGDRGVIVTLGAHDRCVYQWTVALEEGEESAEDLPDPPACNAPMPKPRAGGEEADGEEEDNGEEDDDGERAKADVWSGDNEDIVQKQDKEHQLDGDGPSTHLLDHPGASVSEVPSALPWLEESGGSALAPCVPDENLKLEWIHGYSAQGARQNLIYNRNGDIVYPAAGAGVVMTKCTKPQPHRQNYNLDHTEAITCLTIHPDKAHIATGQEGPLPFVLVWDSTSEPIRTKARLQLGDDKSGVSQVYFSADGKLLAVACEDRRHTVMIFRWEAGLLRCQARLGVKKALSLCFSQNASELVAAGYKHFKVWTLSGGGQMQGRRGLFGSGSKVRVPQESADDCSQTVILDFHRFTRRTGAPDHLTVKQVQILTCAAALTNEEGGSSFVLGGSSGNLLKLEGRKISSEIEAHEGPIYALYAYPATDGSGTCLVTGGADGKIKTWDAELGVVNEFELAGRPYLWGGTPCVRSVCLNNHSDARKILIGTACSEILEISASDGTDVNGAECLMRGHFRDQLWGLAAHPAKAIYSSSGDDGMLKEWDAGIFALKREIALEGWVRCVRYSPNGLLIACGMGGEIDAISQSGGPTKRHSPREEDGTIKIVSGMEESFRIVNTLADAVGSISSIRFSPDGNRMAAASLDGSVYIYSVLENFKLECVAEGGQGGILRIDFSSDGKWIRAEARASGDKHSTQSGATSMVLSAESGELCEDSKVVDLQTGFATWSGLWSEHVNGIWPADAASPVEVTSCCRSLDGSLLATSDLRGNVKLFRYPTPGRAASFKSFKAHAARARSVCFLGNNGGSQNVLSVGGNDRCVMQWKVIRLAESASTTMEDASQAAKPESDPWLQAEFAAATGPSETEPVRPSLRPSGGAIPPTTSAAHFGTSMSLEFAYGYNSSGQARNNLGFSNSGKVILPCASVGVVYDKVLFTGHNGMITSLAVSPCGRYVATGEEDRNAPPIIWDPATAHQICQLTASFRGAVQRLSFSPDGCSLCGIGGDRDNSLCVWESASGTWTDGARVALGQGPRRMALFVVWTRTTSASPYQIMTGGQEYVAFWALRPHLTSRLGREGSKGESSSRSSEGAIAPPEERAPASNETVNQLPLVEKVMAHTFTCGVSIGDMARSASVTVTGTASGAFAVWENHECVRMLKAAHGAAILCLSPACSGGFVSGGADGVVHVWDENLGNKGTPITVGKIGTGSDAIKAVTVNRTESNMAVGTSSGMVAEVCLDSGDVSVLVDGPAPANPVAEGGAAHSPNRSDVARSHAEKDIFVTVAHDGYIRKWSVDGRRLMAKLLVGAPEGAITAPGIGAVGWSSGGSFVACGLSSGDVVIVSPGDMTVLSRCPSDKKPKCAVSALAISQDETTVTVGCEDGSLHGMKVTQGGERVQHAWSSEATTTAGGAVVAMDVSADGKVGHVVVEHSDPVVLKTTRYCSTSGPLSYVTAAGVAMDAAPPGDDASTWAGGNCSFGQWGTLSTSSTEATKMEATASARSSAKDLLATASHDGSIALWHYPELQEKSCLAKGNGATVSAPASLTFTADDSKLIAVGGKNGSILQWNVSRV